jgi:hypothetical protein
MRAWTQLLPPVLVVALLCGRVSPCLHLGRHLCVRGGQRVDVQAQRWGNGGDGLAAWRRVRWAVPGVGVRCELHMKHPAVVQGASCVRCTRVCLRLFFPGLMARLCMLCVRFACVVLVLLSPPRAASGVCEVASRGHKRSCGIRSLFLTAAVIRDGKTGARARYAPLLGGGWREVDANLASSLQPPNTQLTPRQSRGSWVLRSGKPGIPLSCQ